MADLLPEDTLYNIFPRIPIKSLARFRCVCKQWREYINDTLLANIHHHVKDERKLLHNEPINSSKIPFYRSKSSNLFTPVSVLSLLHITMEDTTTGSMRVKKDLSPGFIFQVNISSMNYAYHKRIQGYCNGLIAMVHEDHLGHTFVVINPLTKECHKLPRLKGPNHEILTGQGLGFDNSTNTFKMVCVLEEKQVLTLMGNDDIGSVVLVHVLGTDSWREILQVPLYRIHGEAVYANGRLYWPVYPEFGSYLVWFDMKKEEFGVIDLPKETEPLDFSGIVDLNGEVGCLYDLNRWPDEVVEVWILKNEDQWIIHCVYDESKCGSSYRLAVLGCWNQDGDLLMSSYDGLKFVYRLKSGSFDKLIGPDDEGAGEEEKAEVRMYQSSLLSIRKWH